MPKGSLSLRMAFSRVFFVQLGLNTSARLWFPLPAMILSSALESFLACLSPCFLCLWGSSVTRGLLPWLHPVLTWLTCDSVLDDLSIQNSWGHFLWMLWLVFLHGLLFHGIRWVNTSQAGPLLCCRSSLCEHCGRWVPWDYGPCCSTLLLCPSVGEGLRKCGNPSMSVLCIDFHSDTCKIFTCMLYFCKVRTQGLSEISERTT